MHADLHDFLSQLAGAVGIALLPVVLVAFLSMPMSLGRHPGEAPLDADALPTHMS